MLKASDVGLCVLDVLSDCTTTERVSASVRMVTIPKHWQPHTIVCIHGNTANTGSNRNEKVIIYISLLFKTKDAGDNSY